MEEKYLDMLEFLDTVGPSALYVQRETGFARIPFEMERSLYRFIYEGKPDEMTAFYRQMILSTPSIKVPVGKTSHDRLRQLKYAAVAAIAIACRAAILGGAPEAPAYAKSDDAILHLDGMRRSMDVLKIELRTLVDYAAMVQHAKSQTRYSPAVRGCVEYITVHSHHSISLDALAEGTPYTKEYLAKLFKKEVGMSVSDYALRTRIDEAKTLLAGGQACSDVAHTLGFSSQSYFIRQFKKATGMTPRLYRSLNS